MFKQIMTCLGLAALAMASPASSQQSPQNPTGQPLRIGASASFTGKAYSVQGNYVREGYLLCQKHVNAQGGVLGRPIEFVIYDDESDGKKAALLYEKLITEDKVDVVLGPYGTEITEAVADVPEKHHKLMIAPTAATSSIWQKGRRYIIMVLAPVDSAAIGVLDIAAHSGLKTVAIITQDALLPKAVAKGTNDIAKSKGLEVVLFETYPNGTTDFSDILNKVKTTQSDVFVAASVRIDDLAAITHKMREVDLNAKMLASLPYGLLPEYYQRAGKDAEFAYAGTFWEASLPHPGNRGFVAAYEKEYNHAPVVQSAASYAGCQILMEAVRRAGTTDSDKLRETVLGLKTKTVLGDFAVDEHGFQVGQKAVTIQWQDGKQVVVWPEEVASGKLRFPAPPWNQR
jgi:branched-chain amino acid transport system substrate-binding protein